MNADGFVARADDGERVPTDWGELTWKIAGERMPGAEMTFGTCLIAPGQRNPLHAHPNCEEFLYVVSGSCEHRLDDEMVILRAGDTIRIPRNVKHWARALGEEPLFALIVFSSGNRQAVTYEEAGEAGA
jgi:quercetin dioxygenase-like cupin family protein